MAPPSLSPSLPTVVRPSLHAASCDDYAKAASHRPFRLPPQLVSSTSYEHFSALRSTHCEGPSEDMFQPVCDGSHDCGLAAEDFDCDECVQGCEDASCTVEFTSQCTEQCVVVACTDPHHEVDPCGKIADGQDCAKQCTGELDCTVFEEFVSAVHGHSAMLVAPLELTMGLTVEVLQRASPGAGRLQAIHLRGGRGRSLFLHV